MDDMQPLTWFWPGVFTFESDSAVIDSGFHLEIFFFPDFDFLISSRVEKLANMSKGEQN